jgi:hypothetical protein
MADDTESTDATSADDTTETKPDETPGEDVSGLKSALGTEREQRKALEKELKALRTEQEAAKQAAMTDHEKAVANAKAEGMAEAMKTAGTRLAAAELKSAAAAKGLNLSEVSDLINVAQFVDDQGEVDEKAIQKAVDKLAKLAPSGPNRSGAQIPGGSGRQRNANPTLDSAVAAHYGT